MTEMNCPLKSPGATHLYSMSDGVCPAMKIILPPPLTVMTRVKFGCLKIPGGLVRSLSTAMALMVGKASAPASTAAKVVPRYRLRQRMAISSFASAELLTIAKANIGKLMRQTLKLILLRAVRQSVYCLGAMGSCTVSFASSAWRAISARMEAAKVLRFVEQSCGGGHPQRRSGSRRARSRSAADTAYPRRRGD